MNTNGCKLSVTEKMQLRLLQSGLSWVTAINDILTGEIWEKQSICANKAQISLTNF